MGGGTGIGIGIEIAVESGTEIALAIVMTGLGRWMMTAMTDGTEKTTTSLTRLSIKKITTERGKVLNGGKRRRSASCDMAR